MVENSHGPLWDAWRIEIRESIVNNLSLAFELVLVESDDSRQAN
jgi:hypothetical protein